MSERERQNGEAVNPSVAYEARDIRVRPLVRIAIGVLAAAVTIHLAVWGLYALLKQAPAPGPPTYSTIRLPPEPRLQSSPAADLDAWRARQQGALNTYSWVDQQKGVVRIPIDRAMQLLVERGLPNPSATAPTATTPTLNPTNANVNAQARSAVNQTSVNRNQPAQRSPQ